MDFQVLSATKFGLNSEVQKRLTLEEEEEEYG